MASSPARPASAPSSDEPQSNGLSRRIGGALLFFFILGDVLGAGVYALTGVLAGQVGGAIWLPLLVALLLALLTAGSYAELVTKYPKAGGAAVFAARAYERPIVSFLVGFAMLAAGVTSAAGLALAFAGDYLRQFVDVPTGLAAIVFLLLVAALNARGITESLGSNTVMTIIEVGGLAIVIGCAALLLIGGGGDLGRTIEISGERGPAFAVLGAAVVAYYSFVGFETSANIAEEVRDPTRSYPRALFASLIVAGAVYVLVGLASSAVLPTDELAGSTAPLLDVVAGTGVGVPAWLFGAIALIAVANGALLTMIMASRVTYGMAREGLLPRVLGRTLAKRRTPWVAILVTTAVACLLTLVGDLETLASTVVLLLLLVFISTNLAVLVLRRDRVEHAHFRVRTAVPVLGIGSCILLLTRQEPIVWAYGAALLGVGVVLHLIARATGSRGVPDEARETDVEREPHGSD